MISPVWYVNDPLQLMLCRCLTLQSCVQGPTMCDSNAVFWKLVLLGYKLQRLAFINHISPQLNTFGFGCVQTD